MKLNQKSQKKNKSKNYYTKIMDDDEAIHYLIDNVVSRINLATMLFGIIGNLICIFVLVQKSLINRKFNWYLLALARISPKQYILITCSQMQQIEEKLSQILNIDLRLFIPGEEKNDVFHATKTLLQALRYFLYLDPISFRIVLRTYILALFNTLNPKHVEGLPQHEHGPPVQLQSQICLPHFASESTQ